MRLYHGDFQFQQRGAALLMVVGLIAIMGTLVVGIQYEISRSISYVQSIRATEGARRMAEVGLSAAMILLKYDHEEDTRSNAKRDYYFQMDEEETGLDALAGLQNAAELWSMFSPEGFNPLESLGISTTMLPIGTSGGVELVIEEQSGKWNFHRLLTARGVQMNGPEAMAAINGIEYLIEDNDLARSIVAAGIDWMDANNQVVDPLGAERLYYEELDSPYEPRNGPFQHHAELRALANVDEDVYAALLSGVTIWPNDLKLYSHYKININTAPREALFFLHEDMTEDVVDEIITEREEEPFKSKNEFGKVIQGIDPNLWSVKAEKEKKDTKGILVRDIIDVRSRAFLIKATGFTLDGQATLEAVVDRDNDKGTLRVMMRRWKYLL